MNTSVSTHCTAFEGSRCIASGELKAVAMAVKKVVEQGSTEPVLVFDDDTCVLVELDLRGTPDDVARRLAQGPHHGGEQNPPCDATADTHRGPGRPRLGVVAREVTLLPRHWDWLASQPGGASVALRKLVEEARRANAGKDRVRQAQEAAYRFMSAIAGHQSGFEEASKALFAGDAARFDELVEAWPVDVRLHAKKLAIAAFEPQPQPHTEGSAE
ncbi:MAG: DUF2239 family protein [Rhodoferax sp.]|nr:DUF2239 family protein [Rhodoferax sp.]